MGLIRALVYQSARREAFMIINKYRAKNNVNESRGSKAVCFSRICHGCNKEAATERFVSTECGHTFCTECAVGKEACPVCKKTTTLVRLFENEDRSRQCSICLCEKPMDRMFFKKCGHVFCKACIYAQYLDAQHYPIRCPFCRKRSVVQDLEETQVSIITSRVAQFSRFVTRKVGNLLT